MKAMENIYDTDFWYCTYFAFMIDTYRGSDGSSKSAAVLEGGDSVSPVRTQRANSAACSRCPLRFPADLPAH